jgi:DNA (cytosine-5)-methyltransferase 1
MKFIDLFAGLGGFHVALTKLDHICVAACEKDPILAKQYEKNFNIPVHKDIKTLAPQDIPSHDILCAGFPCQPFSKAGYQKGLEDEGNGSLFGYIVNILNHHNPTYFILENVPNITKHNDGSTWKYIKNKLHDENGYNIDHEILSPHQYGIPQIRKRVFIVGSKNNLSDFSWPVGSPNGTHISSILEKKPIDPLMIGSKEHVALEIWQDFLDRIPPHIKLPSFPIWTMEFGANYPFELGYPGSLKKIELNKFKDAFGVNLKELPRADRFLNLPKYAKQDMPFPRWKQNFIKQNRDFYDEIKIYIDPILDKIKMLPPSWQKFEWNCQGEPRNLDKLIIQFRASGIRVKRPNYSPSLVASTLTQLPIVGWEKRYITVKEAARLQSLDSINITLPTAKAYKALGNAVNSELVYRIANNLIK